MRIQTLPLTTGILLLACAFAVVVAPEPQAIATNPTPNLQTAKPAAGLIFEPNLGQASDGVSFLARAPRYELALRPDRMTMNFTRREARESVRLDMDVVNADPAAQGEGQQPLQSKTNYYVGDDPAKWRTGVPHFRQVKFNHVYEGVDLVYHPSGENEHAPGGVDLEYDFVVAPGVDPDVIQLRFRGHEQISVDRGGDLVLETPAGRLRHARPIVYQQIAGVRNEVPSRYRLSDMGTLGFTVGEYDRTQPLVIDPTVRDAQHVGGADNEIISDIAVCTSRTYW